MGHDQARLGNLAPSLSDMLPEFQPSRIVSHRNQLATASAAARTAKTMKTWSSLGRAHVSSLKSAPTDNPARKSVDNILEITSLSFPDLDLPQITQQASNKW
jgi:hypothetical protein